MTTLNYNRLMALKPTVYAKITNTLGQSFDLVEHPIKGDEYPVIILYHEEKIAADSGFYDTDDMMQPAPYTDYVPYYIYGELHFGFELDPEDLIL